MNGYSSRNPWSKVKLKVEDEMQIRESNLVNVWVVTQDRLEQVTRRDCTSLYMA